MILERIMKAPINLYYDLTPVGRIQKKFGGDLDCIEHRFFGHLLHIGHIFFDTFWLFFWIATNLPIILLTFIPLMWNLVRMKKQIRPATKECEFLRS